MVSTRINLSKFHPDYSYHLDFKVSDKIIEENLLRLRQKNAIIALAMMKI